MLVNGKKQMTGDEALSEIYAKEKDPDDGFLYIFYASELTWGNNQESIKLIISCLIIHNLLYKIK